MRRGRKSRAFGRIGNNDPPRAHCPSCGAYYNPYKRGLGCPNEDCEKHEEE